MAISKQPQIKLPEPEAAAGKEAYLLERELALGVSERRRENFERYQRSARRSAEVDYLPTILDIENVSRCNFRCIMCMTNDYKNGKRAADMSLASFQKLIDEQYGLVEIKIHGIGEPLLQGDVFFEMVRYARAQHIWVRTVTNGSVLHKKGNYKKLIDTDINEVQISIDGADRATYEKIRRFGNYEQVAENCKLINSYCRERQLCRTKMWTVVQKDNEHQLEELVELAADLGFTNQVFSLQLCNWGSEEWEEKNRDKTLEGRLNYERLFALMARGQARGVKVWFWDVTQKYDTSTPETLCPWPFERAFISSDSRTVPCSIMSNPEIFEIGKGLSFEKAWTSADYTTFRRMHLENRLPKACQSCYSPKK